MCFTQPTANARVQPSDNVALSGLRHDKILSRSTYEHAYVLDNSSCNCTSTGDMSDQLIKACMRLSSTSSSVDQNRVVFDQIYRHSTPTMPELSNSYSLTLLILAVLRRLEPVSQTKRMIVQLRKHVDGQGGKLVVGNGNFRLFGRSIGSS